MRDKIPAAVQRPAIQTPLSRCVRRSVSSWASAPALPRGMLPKPRREALALASLIFGLSHIFHAPYPNWKYVLLASIAGLFYGHVWMRTGSLLPGALVHGLVDITWHVLFR